MEPDEESNYTPQEKATQIQILVKLCQWKMKMFNMIGIGERAGSGIPDIYQFWENEGWPVPVVEESYNPDRTRLSLEFAKNKR